MGESGSSVAKGDGPSARAAANVNEALIGRFGQGSTVEAIVVNEPHAVLQICRFGQLGE